MVHWNKLSNALTLTLAGFLLCMKTQWDLAKVNVIDSPGTEVKMFARVLQQTEFILLHLSDNDYSGPGRSGSTVTRRVLALRKIQKYKKASNVIMYFFKGRLNCWNICIVQTHTHKHTQPGSQKGLAVPCSTLLSGCFQLFFFNFQLRSANNQQLLVWVHERYILWNSYM